MQFNNRPNQCIWISRSVAVLCIPFFYCDGQVYVPLGKRSSICPTEVGKWALPGGYLDWDESASETVIRETWEELGLNLEVLGKPKFGDLEQPYYVFSNPRRDAAQNVTLRFHCIFEVDALPKLRPSQETDDADWFGLAEAQSMNLAFNHASILRELPIQ